MAPTDESTADLRMTDDCINGDEDEEFVDAQEELASRNSEAGDDDDESSSLTDPGLIGRAFRGEDMDIDDVEEDLFESTFGQKASTQESDNDDVVAKEHTKGCDSSHRPPTPEDAAPATSTQPQGPHPINVHRDRSWQLRRLTRFYDRAKELIPRLPLASHRYWIGVLVTEKSVENFKAEKDFIWMKGNRKSTVETIWNMFQQSTATENFTLLLGYEKVDFKDCVEELDYFGERKVIFRAVENRHPDADGKEVSEGVVPKGVVAPATKKKKSEVIVLEDDD